MVQLNMRRTPDGTVVERLVNGERVATGTYASVADAVEGIRIELAAVERAYHFPGMTDSQAEVEEFAGEVERALDRRCRS
jgi:hypothetical protein